MSKDPASVPLNNLGSTSIQNEPKPAPRTKRPQAKTSKFKVIVLVLIFLLIVVLITALTIVILRTQQTPCQPPSTTSPPYINHPPRMRTANRLWNEYHLPLTMTATHYDLTFQLLNTTYNLSRYNNTNTFYGLAKLQFVVNSQTNFVVLHARYLSISSIIVKASTGFSWVDVKIVEQIYDNYYDYLILALDKSLRPGTNCTIEIKYSGIMTNDESGIITTTYYDLGKKQKFYILYSKLEPIGARRIFPCFDEPDKKVTFTVKIIHEERFKALSNMPLDNKKSLNFSQLIFSSNNWNSSMSLMISQFKPTEVQMSIYLLAFVVIENYDNVTKYRQTDKNVSIWYPTELKERALIPLNYSAATENFFERYLNYSSPLPKTDHIYIPDFLSGAMENWGLVTYRDQHLLVSEKSTEHQAKTGLMTIAHEIAHFWFGNWLTTKTWGEIWLNEGFATYFASVAYYQQTTLNKSMGEEFFLYERRHVLNKDVRFPTPVIVNVTDPRTFKGVFNSLTYQKGQALLVWLESIMGQSNFLKGIQNYIKKFAMKNPTNSEFFDVMDEIGPAKSDLINIPNLKSFFHPWLYKPGFPTVMVNYDLAEEKIILTQQSNQPNSSLTDKWPIHITYKTSKIVEDIPVYFNDKYVLNRKLDVDEFLVFNSNGKSYLRVNYSEMLWKRIIDEFKAPNSKINQINKIVLLDDACYFLENNSLNISIVKDLLASLVNETNPTPWLIFYYKIFDKLHELFKEDVLFDKFSSLVKKLSTKILRKILKSKFDIKANLVDDINQRIVLTMNCEIGNDEALDWVSKKFQSWILDPAATKLPNHLSKIILFYGLRINDKRKHWMTMWKLFTAGQSENSLTYGTLATGLAGTSKPYLLNKLLNQFLIPNTHRSIQNKQQDFLNTIEWITKSSSGVTTLHRWVVRNADRIKKFAFGELSQRDQMSAFQSLLLRIFKGIYEPHVIIPFIKLNQKHSIIQETVTMNNNWRETTGKKLIKFL